MEEKFSERVGELLRELIDEGDFQINNWVDGKFFKMKQISTTEKGDIAEDLLCRILRYIGYSDITKPEGRRGPWDVCLNSKLKFEVKMATQDKSNSFQFNGIRLDTKYTHLFCLGITPNHIHYLIVEKRNLDQHKLVSMAKGANSAFKLTRTIKQMKGFDTFKCEIERELAQ